jgi:paraquat-inducible protein A
MRSSDIIVCDHCDLVLHKNLLDLRGSSSCSRCGHILFRTHPLGLHRCLIFLITAVFLFIIANIFPIVTISSNGLKNSSTLLEAVYRLFQDGIPSIAFLVFFTAFLMPALQIFSLTYLLLPLKFGHTPLRFGPIFRLVHQVRTWAMLEVFLLGLIVTITKLNAFAEVTLDIGFISFILLMISITATSANFDKHSFWKEVDAIKLRGQR